MNIQIRHVSEEVHRVLKVRAAQAGMTLSDYLLRELEALAERPTMEELMDRVERRGPLSVETPSARAIREERESRP